MLLSLLLIFVIAAGGFALTYLIENDEPFLWRVAAGTVIGSAVFGTLSFVLAMFFGLNAATVLASLAVTLIPLKLILSGDRRKTFQHDWAKAKGKLQGANWAKAFRCSYYAVFLLLFVFFFDRAMIETDQGILTGGSNNLGDLPFHLGAIFSFTDGSNFPPQNPSFAGARFSYPFIADFVTAAFMKLGIGVRDAMFVQNVAWAFSLLVILERFVFKLTNDRLASKLAPALLFFSGGLGFIWFFGDFGAQAKGLFEFIGQLPKDYTIGQDFRWGNSLITLFMTQRSLLLGMPITLIAICSLWRIFNSEPRRDGETEFSIFHFPFSTFIVGLIAGLLPLIHLHSLVVLFVVTAFLFFFRMEKWRDWTGFGIGVCLMAIPQLLWSISGSATETTKFFDWHFGWDSGDANFVWFWIKNTGLLFPLLAFGIYSVYSTQRHEDAGNETGKSEKVKGADSSLIPHPSSLFLFYLPFAFLFLISNVAKLAPWEWDNIKVLIYWYVGSIPFVAFAVSWMWRKATAAKIIAAACFVVLIFSGSLDVWRTVSGQIKSRVFDSEAVMVAERIKRATPPHALILNAPTYNSAIVLTGRQSLMRYPGHLGSHGIDYAVRERDVKSIYSGGANADELMRKYGIEYVLISPEERSSVAANEQFFKKFSVIAEAGQYKVYKVK
ncbi:MAG: hypothetical protein WBD27_10405 [Pyrinomonadaceae bacterium]